MSKPIAIAAVVAALLATPAFAHITFENRDAEAGSTARLVLRVPHGCDGGAATVRIRVRIPDGVVNVKPMPHAGWELTTVRGPLAGPVAAEHGAPVSEGVREIMWSGRLLDEHYDEFVFRAQMPTQAGMLYFPTVQECERGVHRWIEIPAAGRSADDYNEPAPGLQVTPRR
jgi:uncharacterized protein YcnI